MLDNDFLKLSNASASDNECEVGKTTAKTEKTEKKTRFGLRHAGATAITVVHNDIIIFSIFATNLFIYFCFFSTFFLFFFLFFVVNLEACGDFFWVIGREEKLRLSFQGDNEDFFFVEQVKGGRRRRRPLLPLVFSCTKMPFKFWIFSRCLNYDLTRVEGIIVSPNNFVADLCSLLKYQMLQFNL